MRSSIPAVFPSSAVTSSAVTSSTTMSFPATSSTSTAMGTTGSRAGAAGPISPPAPGHTILSTTEAEARWSSAVADRPLEQPRPFTGRLARLARTVAGRPVQWSTGPATRAALTAAGATAATTGTVVHLPAPPHRSDPEVLVHELAHLRTTVARPRFLRPGASASADSEEQRAIAATAAVRTASLPVAGLAGVPRAVDATVRRTVEEVSTGSTGGVSTGSTAGEGSTGGVSTGSTAGEGSTAGVSTGSTAGQGLPAAAGIPAGEGSPGGMDVDAMVELLEIRLLREFERRGGRFADVF